MRLEFKTISPIDNDVILSFRVKSWIYGVDWLILRVLFVILWVFLLLLEVELHVLGEGTGCDNLPLYSTISLLLHFLQFYEQNFNFSMVLINKFYFIFSNCGLWFSLWNKYIDIFIIFL